MAQACESFEPLTRRVFEVYGLMPVPGDGHLCEYLPYTHNPARNAWSRYKMRMFDFDKAAAGTEENWKRIRAMADGTESLDSLKNARSERIEALIAAIVANRNAYEPAINLPNEGHIENLPSEAVVEVPAVINSAGVHGLAMGSLPEGVAELCRREAAIAGLVVESAIECDRLKAIEAMALCPMVDDVDLAVELVDDYIEANRDYFPEFD